MLTPPTSGEFRTVTATAVAGPPGEVDTLRFTLPLTREMVGFLEESDVEAILQVAVDRLRTLHPEYEVQTYSTWSGVCATDPVTEYTPPTPEPSPTEPGQTTG